MFSILIPTWNNLPYLQHCVRSIRQNSSFTHQIIVVVNEGNDGTVEWLKNENIEYIHHNENVGICVGLNSATDLIKEKFVVYLNDDMYVLPNWDLALNQEIEQIGHQNFMLSGTMIEPRFTGNACVLVQDFGDDLESFKEKDLLEYHEIASKTNWSGASWPPVLIPSELWKKVGGMSEEFSPGMYSDPDLSMKLWQEGIRTFKGIGNSRVYHFGSKSTRKLGKNVGRQIFLQKWGITPGYFYRNFLKMGKDWQGDLPNYRVPFHHKLINQVKKLRS
ncbi:MAG: glycosyltransferase [Bacteroidia bacterium]|nr:glycosyltransferase [Bacteroidia bacterium]